MSDKDAPAHLEPDEIRYLALEGGGGKGFAYLGAIEVLEKLDVMKHIDGVAGTSAGAITALMLSLGMTAEDVTHELEATDFNTFFDPPRDKNRKRRVPAPFAYSDRDNTPLENQILKGSLDPRAAFAFFQQMIHQPSRLAFMFDAFVWLLALSGEKNHILDLIARKAEGDLAPVAALLRGLPEYLAFFDRDMGFFSGEAARDYFDDLIRRRLPKGIPKDGPSLPFFLHKKIFKRDLLLCGANMSTGKSVLFSWKHTPYFPVIDAVRISMSLPLVYKPYVIEATKAGWPPCGTYIDGGIWNNLPFREISVLGESRRAAKGKGKSAAAAPEDKEPADRPSLKAATEGRKTLGLRLEISPPQKVLTGGDLVASFMGSGLTAGESQVIADVEPFTLLLDTTGLDLLKFSPDKATKDTVNPRSRRATYRYFGKPIPAADEDVADDVRVKDAKARNACK